MSVTVIISHCFTLFPCVLHFLNLFGIEFVANRALWVALNLSRITHFWCKFLGPKKAACVNVLTFCSSGCYNCKLLLFFSDLEHFEKGPMAKNTPLGH